MYRQNKMSNSSDCTTISAVHSDIIQTHIFTRLDGPALASASCASSQLRALSTEDNIWKDIATSTWPSINNPRVQYLISTFPSGHRSFYSDSFPALSHRSNDNKQRNHNRPCLASELISAVDIYYNNEVIFSKVQETETETGWFRSSPFRVDLLDPKEMLPTSIIYSAAGDDDESFQSRLEESLTLSWIVIDPTRKRSANVSSLRPVSVQRHWLTGDIQVRYGTILAGNGYADDSSEFVQCGIVVTCGGDEEGEKIHVREVSMHVEDMDGKVLNGEESLVILQEALESGKRKKKGENGEERERYEEYKEMKRERKERKQRRERSLDILCISFGVSIFVSFWSFVLLVN